MFQNYIVLYSIATFYFQNSYKVSFFAKSYIYMYPRYNILQSFFDISFSANSYILPLFYSSFARL